MTTTIHRVILNDDEEYCAPYNITNSQSRLEADEFFSYLDQDDNAGLLIKALSHYDGEQHLAHVVRCFDIQPVGRTKDYFDDGLFRVNFLRLLRGHDADGWKITRIAVKYGRLTFCLYNPSLAALTNEQRALLMGFKHPTLDPHNEETTKDDRPIADFGSPISTVLAYWKQPESIEGTESPELDEPKELAHGISFYFDVWAPKSSGKYSKNRRTGIYLTEDGITTVVEYGKHHRREIEFLKPTPEQTNAYEQPVIITEYYE